MASFSQEEWTAIFLSLRVASVATVASLPIGIALAWVLARCRFPGKSVLDGLIHLPLVMPPVVTGYLLLLTFGRKGLIGGVLDQCCGIVFSFRWTGAALAAAVMGLPLMVRAIRLTIEAIDRRLEQAAGTLGAPPTRSVPHAYSSACRSRYPRRRDLELRQSARRVRCHHHLRVEHSR